VGGAYVETLAKAMAEGGILMIYGGLSGAPTLHPHWSSAFREISVRSWIASSIWNRPERYAQVQRVILDGLASGRLKPVISRTFPFEQIVEAHRYLESNQQLGKIVVMVG
jgi:NADPH:quinone reductase-like Zn-dependent oxidoreductase